ncbi:MAG TPA: hypothetical protein VEK57_19325 [Thermoanaerobaculia bacterium]|nr:hypothetical protein [Thermoanaerobaculia bacterium]
MTAIPVPVDPQVQRLYEVARDYRAKGYRVVVGPSQNEVPAFLRGTQPDVLAFSEGDNAVVEVKRRESLIGTNELEEIARRIEAQPGWRLELVLLASRNAAEDPLPPRASINRVDALLTRARELSRSAEAVVPAWLAVEHAMLIAAERSGLELPSRSPTAALKTLFAYGLLSKEAYDQLTAAMRVRNDVVTGRAEDVDAGAIVETIATIVHELLNVS